MPGQDDAAMAPAPSGFGRVQHELHGFYKGLSMNGADMGAWCQLFFDNLGTLLGVLIAVQDMENFGVSRGVINETVFGKIVPGVGISLLVGNVYYSWQAIRLTNKFGRQYTAQPYGINTPAAFSFVFNIMYTVYFIKADFAAGNNDEAFLLAYKVALAANFITGLIGVFLGCFGRLILKIVPPAALLVPIAGIGIAFLGLEQLTGTISAPLVGYSTIMWVFLGWYAGIKVGVGPWRIPEAVMVILVGVVLGWATGLNKKEDVREASDLVKWWGLKWTGTELFEDFGEVVDYLGIVIPIGISASSSTLMCLVSAKEAGDPFPVHETMISDGIGTMIGAFFGNPFGAVIYIGHPAYKRSGAQVGYSLANGILYMVMSLIGVLALIQSFVNRATIGPIILFVGIMINEEALNFIPSRHYAAYIVGLFPSIYDWVVNISNRSPLEGTAADGGSYNTGFPGGSGWIGVLAWKRGALLVSMVWTSMIVMVIDRKWTKALIWALVGAAFSVFGIIHMPEAGFEFFSEPHWEYCSGPADSSGVVATPSCWDQAEQWMFFVAYMMLAGTFSIIELAKRFDETIQEEVDDESAHAFDDWFKDAAKGQQDSASSSDDEDLKKSEMVEEDFVVEEDSS
jgi:AGZA family xanthine/uracil permease-like MFS transporter